VVILGAGASVDFGLPTMAGVFKDAAVKAYLQTNQSLLKMLDNVFMQPHGLTLETCHKRWNIEGMLTYLKDIEMTQQSSLLPGGLRLDEIESFRRGLYVAIEKAVFEGKSSKGMHLNPLINVCSRRFDHITWASFNWDCVFESSFWYLQGPAGRGRRVNPRLAVEIANWRQGTAQHLLLKLHGAINWWTVDGVLTYFPWTGGESGPLQQKWHEYERNATKDLPVLLEPSFYKYQDERYGRLKKQWGEFSDRLSKAKCVLIVGYSLPESDTYARSMIHTAYRTNAKCSWLLVDPSKKVFRQYKKLVGPRRLQLKHLPMTLEDFNRDINMHLGEFFP
jgi:hypothetical protein